MNGLQERDGIAALSIDETAEGARELLDLRTVPSDIVCAFNFSTCCLHSREQLLRYFSHVRKSMNEKGGVFAMDLYGGMSSEIPLKLKRAFDTFTVCNLSS